MSRRSSSKINPEQAYAAGGKLEADSLFKSPYYPDSYDFPYNPDPLCPGNNYSTYDSMRDDDQVKAALSLKKDMVLNSGWEIICKKEDVRGFVERNFRQMGEQHPMEPGFEESLRDCLSSYDYGFALGEILYNPPGQTTSSKWELRSLRVRPPHSFLFHIDAKGNVLEIEQIAEKGQHKFNPDIFLHNVYQSDFGNPYGKSDLRSAHPAWKAKKFIFKMAMRYAERFAGGTAIGRYMPGAGPAEISALHTALRSIQDNTTLTVPDDTKIEILQSVRDSSDSYNKILMMLNMWIARSILIPDLLGISGNQTQGGSYSLGKEHFKVFMATIANDRMALQKRVTSKMVRPLVQANFGDVDCEFKFKPMETGDESEYLKVWLQAVNAGAFKPNPEEVNHLRAKTGFPQGAVVVAPTPAPEPAPGAIGEDGQEKESLPREKDLPRAGGKDDRPGERVEASRLFRKETPFEYKVNFAAIQGTLDRVDGAIGKEVARILVRMSDDMVDQARARKMLDRFKPEAMAELQPKFQKELNSALRGHFLRLFRAATENARSEILPREKRFVADDILPEDFELIVKSESFKMVGDLSNEVRKRASTRMLEALKNGSPMSELARELSDDIGRWTEGQVQTILRTKTTEVFNAARKIFFETDETAKGLIEGYQFSAVLDAATTEVCERLDGRQFDRDDLGPQMVPPLHWNCRSLLVPITKFESRDFKKPPELETLRRWGANLISKEAE